MGPATSVELLHKRHPLANSALGGMQGVYKYDCLHWCPINAVGLSRNLMCSEGVALYLDCDGTCKQLHPV